MKKTMIFLVILSLFGLGCSNSNNNNGENLGTQIDAMGRPAVNTALVSTFASSDDRGVSEDDYNATPNSDRSRFSDTMAGQLAIHDALAGTCGDNPLTNRATTNPADGLATGAGRYGLLASVFADDRLYVNGNSGGAEAGQCNVYLAAELGVIGVTGFEADCGGRTPTEDVIQTSYSALAAGSTTGVNDGISSDNVTHSLTVFPFLAPAS